MKISTLESSLRDLCLRHDVPTTVGALDRRNDGPVTPNAEIVLQIRTWRKKDYFRLAALSHFLVEPLKTLLRINLEERAEILGSESLRLVLQSKDFCLLYLSRKWSERGFFGNELENLERLLKRMKVKILRPKKERRTIRRRGYRDQGYLRPSHRWEEQHDWSFDQLQNKIEENREFSEACHRWNMRILDETFSGTRSQKLPGG
jgi:hypothetical protein